ncbi:hypothetical protein GTQ34_16595, partial [Muricauda sp. JGD-17]|nr:hypothetical protein [Allomuricauda ochracea]
SALVVESKETPNRKVSNSFGIHVQGNAIINGILAYLDDSDETSFFPQITVAENALIKGEVFCEKNLELKGDVHGSVSTTNFIALEQGGVYQNHLFNGSIDSSVLPLQYSGLLFGNEKSIAKWMY